VTAFSHTIHRQRTARRRAKEHMHFQLISIKAVTPFRLIHSGRKRPDLPQATLSRQELRRIVAEMLD
jgi:hypothetical protein